MTNKFMSEVTEDENGELLVEIPTELLNQMGWDGVGNIDWSIENDKLILKEASNAGRD